MKRPELNEVPLSTIMYKPLRTDLHYNAEVRDERP